MTTQFHTAWKIGCNFREEKKTRKYSNEPLPTVSLKQTPICFTKKFKKNKQTNMYISLYNFTKLNTGKKVFFNDIIL